ncbi:MAG: HAMP domain-containing protein [Deltaproteobacteria bacterium]|nr:HAMP domain-containing protein [Deltaproteobacteria bacterium]
MAGASFELRLGLLVGLAAAAPAGLLAGGLARRERAAGERLEREARARVARAEGARDEALGALHREALEGVRGALLLALGGADPRVDTPARRRCTEALFRSVTALGPAVDATGAQVVTPEGAALATATTAPREGRSLACPRVHRAAPLGSSGLTVAVQFQPRCEAPQTPLQARAGGLPGVVLTALAAALGAGLVGALLARAFTRRLSLVARAAGRVGAGDLSVRVRPHGDTEVDALIRAFNLMVEELALSRERIDYLQRLAGWQEFARRLAHEIKNPLTPIQLAVQEAARKYQGDDARYRRTLDTAREVVEEEVGTLRRLVTAFSDFAKLPEVKPSPGDLSEFLRDAAGSRAFLDEAAGASRRDDVAVVFDAPTEPIPVRIDRMMLRRAFENLVRNAVQALEARAQKGGPGGTVWVRARLHTTREGEAQAWLVVEDDGPGIPPEQRGKVWDPYFTTRAEGTGLGLAIVRKIALDHDGDVGLEARSGGGARFVLTLPLRDPARTPRLSFVTFSERSPSTGQPVPVEPRREG